MLDARDAADKKNKHNSHIFINARAVLFSTSSILLNIGIQQRIATIRVIISILST